MLKNVYIKLTKYGPNVGPFNIYDQWGNLIAENITKKELVDGVGYLLAEGVTMIKLVSVGDCPYEKTMPIVQMTDKEFFQTESVEISTGCIWRHLTNNNIYNTYYGVIKPYVIEHPIAYPFQDQILQSFKDYSKVYQYTSGNNRYLSSVDRINVDNVYFNKMIAYNDQQCSGVLNLVPKPVHNLKEYMRYPIYNSDSKSVLYTKSDNFYQINDISDVLINKDVQMFTPSCENLSTDKIINQNNMIYTKRSFKNYSIRAKDSKIRLILDNRSDTHIISQIVYELTQISYK